MGRRRTHNRSPGRRAGRLGLLLALLGVLATACASGPQVGVRSPYRNASLDSASISPFFSRSQFSLEDEALERRLEWAERAASSWLSERGVQIVDPDETREKLQSADKWGHFADNGIFHVDLAASFESAPRDERRETQTSILRELVEADLSRRFLLFGELLYQTAGECRESARDHTSRATVVVADGAPVSLPRPCVVTHFQARLIDARSGSTVWYNRRLRELHVPALEESWIRENIRNTVRQTLAGDGGITDLVGPAPGES